jgi:hypothetical protein
LPNLIDSSGELNKALLSSNSCGSAQWEEPEQTIINLNAEVADGNDHAVLPK